MNVWEYGSDRDQSRICFVCQNCCFLDYASYSFTPPRPSHTHTHTHTHTCTCTCTSSPPLKTIGIRDSRKIVGQYDLTRADVFNEARFDDTVGIFPEFIDG